MRVILYVASVMFQAVSDITNGGVELNLLKKMMIKN